MNRRKLITLLGGVVAWPLAARAQQRQRVRRIGVLMNSTADDAQGPGPARTSYHPSLFAEFEGNDHEN